MLGRSPDPTCGSHMAETQLEVSVYPLPSHHKALESQVWGGAVAQW